jgi:hypothetical protein
MSTLISRSSAVWAVLGALGLAACAGELEPKSETPDSETTEGSPSQQGGVRALQIDASDEAEWVYLDLATGEVTDTADPAWDLAFRRFRVAANGGASGGGSVALAVLPDGDFDAETTAPVSGWRLDGEDGEDADTEPDTAVQQLGDWYDYDVSTHVLTPKKAVWFVRVGGERAYKLALEGYYDAAGTPAQISIRWAEVTLPEDAEPLPTGPIEPDQEGEENTVADDEGGSTTEEGGASGEGGGAVALPEGAFVLDASDPQGWAYLTIGGAVVTENDPWDLAVRRTQWRTHSGASGTGLGGARISEHDWAATLSAPPFGYIVDTTAAPPGPGGGAEEPVNAVLSNWYDYNPTTHTVLPKDEVYLVRGAAGQYAKLEIHSYSDGSYAISLEPLPLALEIQTTVVDAQSGEWVRFSFRQGAVVTSEDGELAWDLALRNAELGTNSGTSGPGAGGALELGAVALLEQEGTAGEFSQDTLLPIPGPPGSGEYSGNPALATWFDYNPATHTVSPRDTAWLIRTADGGFAQLRITAWDKGAFTLTWVYAGAGRDNFATEETP